MPPFRRYAACLAALTIVIASGAARAQQPNVAHYDVYADRDTIHALVGTGRKGEPEIALWHVRSDDGGATWSAPVRVNRPDDRLSAHHPGENPQIAASGNRVVAVWTQPRAGARRGGLVATAVSDDGGRTFRPGPAPFASDKGSQTFAELATDGKVMHMAFLDSRDGRQSLRYARSTDLGASWTADRPVAPRTCDCCWNSVAALPDGGAALYFRGAEPRDMMLATSRTGEAWRNLGSIGKFNWQVQACPHVGGALATNGTAIHALAWNGRDEQFGLFHVKSADAGSTWTAPRKLGTDDARNADIALTREGHLVAVWDQVATFSSSIQRARSTDDGHTWSAAEQVASASDLSYPRVIATKHGVATFWVDGSLRRGARIVANGKPLPEMR